MLISVVIPVLNEEKSIVPLHKQLKVALRGQEHEILFIDDGSTDGTAKHVKAIAAVDHRVRLVRFQRNFGKAAALSVGFARSKGDIIITMDGDLQDDPSEIPRFIAELKRGYDMVSGWKRLRKDPLMKLVPSRFFNWLTGRVTGLHIHDFNCGFKAYKRRVIENLNLYGELHRYIPALAYWQGFSVGELIVKHRRRRFGKSKYGIERLAKGFYDLLTVKFLMRYAKRPLHFFGWLGVGSTFLGFIAGLWIVYIKIFKGLAVGNRPILFLSALLIIIGVQFISLGLLGEIVSSQSKSTFIVREEVNFPRQ